MKKYLVSFVLLFILFKGFSQDGPFSFSGKTLIFEGNALHWDATQDASTNLVWSTWSDRYIKINGATFKQNGNVGIGTTSPKTKLDLGNNGGAMLTLNPGSSTAVNYAPHAHNDLLIGSYMANGYSNAFISTGYQQDGNRKFHIGSASTNTFSGAGLVPNLTVTSHGYIGIGTPDPEYRLDIREVQPGNALRLRLWNNTTNTAGTESRIDLPVFNGTSGLSIRSMGSSLAGGFNVGSYDGWIHTGQADSYLHFSAGAGQSKHLTIKSDGNVGIGTTTPGSFKLAVNGKIWTQEVTVQMTNPGPDYVFEKDYDLLSLSELETYIKVNKHLPEVPSAKEMEADGLNLKEMNLVLLKKVEELTLHLIEMEKRYEAQQKAIESLKNKN